MRPLLALIVAVLLVACSSASEPEDNAVQPPAPLATQPAEELPEQVPDVAEEVPEQVPDVAEELPDAAEEAPAVATGPEIELGTVRLTVNGTETTGSGVAFVTGTEVHARLLVGPPGEYLQFDLIGNPAESPFALEPGQNLPSTIIGQDVADNPYTLIGEPDANTYTLEWVGDAAVHGVLDMTAVHWDGTRREMTAVFHLVANEGSDWDCDWGGELVNDCDFVTP